MESKTQNLTLQNSLKLPIRLRLKKSTNSETIQEHNPENSLHHILQTENLKLKESVHELEKIEVLSKEHFRIWVGESEKKKRIKDKAYIGGIGIIKEVLKYLYKETEDMGKKNFYVDGTVNELEESKEGVNVREDREERHGKLFLKKGDDGLDDKTSEYEELIRMNSELKSEVSEMEHYIIRLKEELNTKEKEVHNLETNNKMHAAHNTEIENQYLAKHNECTIMKEEILGYEQKIENLESELIEIRRCKSDRVFIGDTKYGKNNDGELNEVNEGSQSSIEKTSVVSVGEESLDESQYRKELENSKLDEIFEKTERVLKKCKLLEEKLEVKEAENTCLKESLNKIVLFLEMKSESIGENHSNLPSADSIITEISSRISETFDKLSIREANISTELNKILSEIDPNKDFSFVKIDEKIEEISSHLRNTRLEERPQQYIDILLNLHSKIEDVITYVPEIEYEINKNNNAVAHLIDEVVDKHALIGTLKEMEELLMKNEESFTDENLELFEHFKVICIQNGLDVGKINSYLMELEDIVKGMHKSHLEETSKFNHEIEELKTEISQLKGIDLEEKVLNLKEKMMTNFYPSSPEFVESILHKIVEVKNSDNREDIEKFVENIFELIREKDEKLKIINDQKERSNEAKICSNISNLQKGNQYEREFT